MPTEQITDFARVQISTSEYLEAFTARNYVSVFPNHWHEHYCISIIEKGIFNENEYFAEEGTVFITNPSEIHKNDLVFENGTSFKTIYLSQSLMDLHSGGALLKIDCRAVKDKTLFNLIGRISDAVFRKSEFFDDSDITLLAKHLSDNYQEAAKTQRGLEIDHKIQTIKRYIDQNYTEKLVIEELSSKVGMKNIPFIKYYKKKTGITPFEYIMMKRIQHGMRLMNDGKSVTDAALSSGFYDQSQFIRYFKKYVGVTPSTYKS
jgi:AraC-like DNA-binding protein